MNIDSVSSASNFYQLITR